MTKYFIRLQEGDFSNFLLSLHNDLCTLAGDPGVNDFAKDDLVLVLDLDPDPGLAPLHLLVPEAGLSEAVLTFRKLRHNPECGGGKEGGGVGGGEVNDVSPRAKNFF